MAHEPLVEVKDLVVRFAVGSGLKRQNANQCSADRSFSTSRFAH